VTYLALLQPLEHFFRHILNGLHHLGLPWAWSIVVLTVIVRMILVPLTVRQIHSMQRMQQFAPMMKEIQKKYKGDRQRMNEELMKFYREHNINPAASCLPLLAQFPVFIGLYYTLRHFAHEPASKHPGSLSWLHFVPSIAAHATTHWGGYVLLAVYVGSQLASTYFMAGTMQQSQRVMMYILPFAFIFVIARFPTGLVLYWMTTNLWTVGQGLITRRLIPKTPLPTTPKRSSRTPPKEEEPEVIEDGAKPAAKAAEPARPPQQPRRVKRKKKKRQARR
jgi:YidC/Oxa1 family membrane protein insertase